MVCLIASEPRKMVLHELELVVSPVESITLFNHIRVFMSRHPDYFRIRYDLAEDVVVNVSTMASIPKSDSPEVDLIVLVVQVRSNHDSHARNEKVG